MVTAALLLSLVLALCITALLGAGLFLVGVLQKRRKRRHVGLIITLSSFVLLAGCFIYTSVKITRKVWNAAPGLWNCLVEEIADDSDVKPLEPAEARRILSGKLGNPTVLASGTVQGVWVECLPLSYGYFVYEADGQALLKAIAGGPVDASFQLTSDSVCREITWDECKKSMLMYPRGPQRNLSGWNPEGVAEKRCYRCMRRPWEHTIVIDARSGKVFHSVSEIRE
jgi:hypothetical protein